MTNDTITRLTPAQTAAEIRKALKAAFPDQPARFFSVRTNTYAGGASIDVRYQGGPSVQDVEAITDAFARIKGYDMGDAAIYRRDPLTLADGEQVRSGVDHVSVDRKHDPADVCEGRMVTATRRMGGRVLGRIANDVAPADWDRESDADMTFLVELDGSGVFVVTKTIAPATDDQVQAAGERAFDRWTGATVIVETTKGESFAGTIGKDHAGGLFLSDAVLVGTTVAKGDWVRVPWSWIAAVTFAKADDVLEAGAARNQAPADVLDAAQAARDALSDGVDLDPITAQSITIRPDMGHGVDLEAKFADTPGDENWPSIRVELRKGWRDDAPYKLKVAWSCGGRDDLARAKFFAQNLTLATEAGDRFQALADDSPDFLSALYTATTAWNRLADVLGDLRSAGNASEGFVDRAWNLVNFGRMSVFSALFTATAVSFDLSSLDRNRKDGTRSRIASDATVIVFAKS